MGPQILGIDIGTTSLKTAVYDHSGQKLASAVVEYTLLTPQNGFVEAPCSIYLESIQACLQQMASSGKIQLESIGIIGFSVQGETLVLLDEHGKPLRNAIVWMDNRASKEAQQLREQFGDEQCYQVTGQVSFEGCWPAAKLLWIRNHEPAVFAKIRHVLLLEDYILYQLTGRFVSEGSLLTSTEYWDIRTRDYWPEMLAFLGIDRAVLPEILESGALVGTLLPDVARQLNLSPQTQVATGCLDQAAGAIGVGNIYPGIFSENIGAALAICIPTASCTYDPHRQMPVHYFALPGTYMMHTFTTGGMCLRWFRDAFCQIERDAQALTGLDAYALMDQEAASVPAGAEGLITLPHLQGAMAPDTNLDAKGVFFGATLRHRKAHFIRSIMESLGYLIRRNLEASAAMGLEIQQIRTMGGGSKSDIWNQIKADITGRPLHVTYSAQDTACLGAAILAGKAAGVFPSVSSAVDAMVHIRKTYQPNPANRAVYETQYQKFKHLFEALTPLFDEDARHPC